MTFHRQFEKEQRRLTHLEKSLALEKLKKRKADTRRKIEMGGLVVKSQMDAYGKSITLGALTYSLNLIKSDENYLTLFQSIGDRLFHEK